MQYSSTSCSSYQWKMKSTPAESKSGCLGPLGNSGVKKSKHDNPESLIHFILINSFLYFWGMKDHVSINCLPLSPPHPIWTRRQDEIDHSQWVWPVLLGLKMQFFFRYHLPGPCLLFLLTSSSPPLGLPWWLSHKDSTCNVGDLGLIPGLGRSPGEGNGYWWQYPGLKNSIDCIVHEVAKSQTRLSDFQFLSPPLRLVDSFLL